MKIAIITHVLHGSDNGNYFAYGPYVREMNIWTKFVDEAILVAPYAEHAKTAIDLQYSHNNIVFRKVPAFDLLTPIGILKSLVKLPGIIIAIFAAMRNSDHIHLRCPGNIGLLGCFVQIFFPRKRKTAKYAGNWDPNAAQPFSYKLQKWLLSNTFLTRNMTVLVYGEWPNATANVKPFFTASYFDADKIPLQQRAMMQPVRFLFVGTLSEGKRPLYAVELVHKLNLSGINATLELYGEGKCRREIEKYIETNQLKSVTLLGNQDQHTVCEAYRKSHFLLLPSKSEGWPKAVAEAMFWGCVPASTKISCVPYMLGDGRGILLDIDAENDLEQLRNYIFDLNLYNDAAKRGVEWSQQFTFERFESEIRKLLK